MTSFRRFYSGASKRVASAIFATGLGLAITGCNSVTDVSDNQLGVSLSIRALATVGDSITLTFTNTSSDTRYVEPCYLVYQNVSEGKKASWEYQHDLLSACDLVTGWTAVAAGAQYELHTRLWVVRRYEHQNESPTGTYRFQFRVSSTDIHTSGGISEIVTSNAVEVR